MGIGIRDGSDKSPYFIDYASELIFYLVELDGHHRMRKLGINRFHYHNKEAATAWRDNIATTISESDHEFSQVALKSLNEIYQSMIK